MPDKSCHPADEPLYDVLMFHRHAHAAPATPIGASEPLFEFIKAQLAILWLIGMNQAGRGQNPHRLQVASRTVSGGRSDK